MTKYETFLASKRLVDNPSGFDCGALPDFLFDFQRDCVKWALRRGRAALFEDCGLGKTPQEHVWADRVASKTGRPVLILAPLCVAQQHVREAAKFGLSVKFVRQQSDCDAPGLYVTNYDKLHHFQLQEFGGVVLDESSILKAFDGSTRKALTEAAEQVPYRLAATATPAPNDLIEIINHAEFLGVMSGKEIIALFFKQDGNTTHAWRLKHHAVDDFWHWVCSWAVNIKKPSDIGYDDSRFLLPPLHIREHIVDNSAPMEGYLFSLPASTLDERRKARRSSLPGRVAKAAELIMAEPDAQWVGWGDLNDECSELAALVDAEEICGATSEEERERITLGFLDGSIRRVVTKPSIWGFGLNLQVCSNTVAIGLSDSYERFYQWVRRFWRFGQDKPVNVHVIISEAEGAVLSNIKRKEAQAQKMAEEMSRRTKTLVNAALRGQKRDVMDYTPRIELQIPKWL